MQSFLRACMWVALATLATHTLSAAVVAPTITSSQIVNNTSGTLFALVVGSNQNGTVYYVASTTEINPTAAEVRNGILNGDVNPLPRRGSFLTSPTQIGSTILSGLTHGRTYFIYFIVENSNGERSTVGRISAVATDLTAPLYNSASLVNITETQFDLRVNLNELATVYYVVSTSAVAPSATQILSGRDETGNPAFKSGLFSVTSANTNTAMPIMGLNSGVQYYAYSVAEDAVGNVSTVNLQTTTTAGSPPCTPGNVTALNLRDGFSSHVLTWTNPDCFDEILVVGRKDNAVTFVPAGDGSAYTASANFGAGSEVLPGQYAVYRGTGATVTITSLNIYMYYHFTVFTRKGTTWSSGTSVTEMVGPPLEVSTYPVHKSTNVPTNQVLTVTFSEPVFLSTNSTLGYITLNHAGVGVERLIWRDGTGDGTISISGNVATITLNQELNVASMYYVGIGPYVFADKYGNDYMGSPPKDFWTLTTVTTATAVNAPTAAVCADQYSALGDIVLTEVADNNFQGTDNGTLMLALEFNKTGFSFSPGATGVTATAAANGDIESVTVTSVSATRALFAVKFKDVANPAAARDHHDAITLSGLKVTRTGASTPPASVVLGASSTLLAQGITPGTTVLANITAGTEPAAPAVAWPDNKSTYCRGTDLSGIAVTASGGASYNWYSDAALTTLIAGGASSQTAAQLFGAAPAAGAAKRYVTNVNGCQSAATEVTLTILAAPVADAGAAQAVCPQASVTLGGEPTASGGAGSYTYAWTGTDGFSSTEANPALNAPENTTNATINIVYTLAVTDSKDCTASDNVTVTVKELSQAVTITEPTKLIYAITGAPVTLLGQPANGSFSGAGVTHQSGVYQFDPQVAGIGTTSVTYTTTLSNGCTKSAVQQFEVKEQIVTGIEPSVAAQIGMHPNPANEAISITLPEVVLRESVTLIVIDAFGRTASVTEIPQGQKVTTVHTAAFAPGVYIVRLETSAGALHRRVVVTHD
jgi:hypothetical protein